MTPAPKRRWFRFSLRTLFVVVTVFSGILCFVLWAFGPEVEQISFDAAAWKRAEPIANYRTVRSQMIDDVLRRYKFEGWTKRQVVQLFGEPDIGSGFEQWDIAYVLGLERAGAFSLDDEALGFRFDANERVIAFGRSVN